MLAWLQRAVGSRSALFFETASPFAQIARAASGSSARRASHLDGRLWASWRWRCSCAACAVTANVSGSLRLQLRALALETTPRPRGAAAVGVDMSQLATV